MIGGQPKMMMYLLFPEFETMIDLLRIVPQGITYQSIKADLKNLNSKASTQRQESLMLVYKLHTSSKLTEQLLYLTTVMLMFRFCHTTNNRKREKLAKNLKNID